MIFLIVNLLLVGVVIQGQEFSCPVDENSVCLDGLYGDPYHCTLYHLCDDCQYTTRECESGLHFDDDEKLCRSPYLAGCDPDNYPRNGSAFCVTRGNGRIDGPVNPLIFSELYANYKSPYDPLTGHLRSAHSGVYFYHMSAGTYPGRKVNMTLAGSPYAFGVVRDSEHHEFDVISRDVLMTLNMYAVVAATLEGDTSIQSDAGKQTMWAGFSVDEFMSDVVTFYAVSGTFQLAPNTIVFEDEHFDVITGGTDGGYDPSTGVYTAPVAGIYLLVFSSGAEAFAEHRSRFVTGGEVLSELRRDPGRNTGLDTLSKSIVCRLEAGQTVSIQLTAGQATNNQSTLLSFGGFLYDPKPPTPPTAWFVGTATTQTGLLDPIVFENEILDVGNVYDPTTNSVDIVTSGYYYLSLYSGVDGENPLQIQLVEQTGADEPVILAEVFRSLPYNTGVDTIGRSLLVHLKSGSQIRIRLAADSVSYSDDNIQTTFSGFLLLAIDDPDPNIQLYA